MTRKKIFSFIMSICLLMTMLPSAFAADDVLPKVTRITPADGTTEVPLMDVVMEVNFSTAMDKATVNTKNITMSYDAIGKIEMSGEKKALIYLKKLQRDTEYEIVFSKGVLSENGVELTRTSSKFTTTAAYPKYRQLINSDMEDTSKLYAYSDAGANTISFAKDGDNTVLKSIVAWDEARVQQMVYLEPNASYEMRARIKSNTAQKIRCVLNYTETGGVGNWYHYDGEVIIEAGQWYDLYAKFQIPSSINPEAYIEIASAKKGSEVYVDDWQFYEVGYDIEAPKMEIGDTEEKTVTMIENTEKDTDYQILQAMGIYGSKEYNEPTEQVTREDFAKYLAKMLGSADMKGTVPSGKFSDIDDSYEGYADIVVSHNLLLPDSNDAFNPYGVITANDALRALIVMSGHQYMLENSLPYGAAGPLGLTKGVNIASNSKLTYSHLNKILRNFIEMDMGLVKDYGTVDGYINENSTVRESILMTNKYRGIVEATNVTSLDNPNGITSGYVRIDGKEYEVFDCDTQDLIGKKVTYYTKEFDDEEKIIYFADIDKYNEIITIDALDIAEYSNNTYKYYVGKKLKKAILRTDKYFIYNHRSSGSYTDSNMIPEYGRVELIDNDHDGKFDIVKVFDYQTVVIQSVDKENGIITDKYGNEPIKVDVDDTPVYSNGVKVEFKTLSAGNILTIASSLDEEYAIIYKSSNTVNGVVSAIKSDEGRNYVLFYDEIHGDEITTKAEYLVNYPGCDKIQLSSNGTFYLDAFGKIVAFEKITADWKFGYFIKTYYNDFDNNVSLKIFTEDDIIGKIESAKKLRIDDGSFKESEVLYEKLKGFESQIIQYKLNSFGEITSIITTSNGAQDGLREIAKVSYQHYLSDSGSVGNKVYIDEETKLFVVPSSHEGAESYEYKATSASSYMYSGKTYSFTAYSNTEKNSVADVIVMYDKTVQNTDAIGVGVVDKITVTLNEYDEVITQIELKTSSADKILKVDNKIDLNSLSAENGESGLKCEKGDIITWTDRIDGYVSDINIIFKAGSKSLKTVSNPSTSFNKAARVFGGTIRDIENTYVKLESDDDYEIYNTVVFKKLLRYDGKIVDETTASEMFENQFVVVVSSWNANTLFVVYKN